METFENALVWTWPLDKLYFQRDCSQKGPRFFQPLKTIQRNVSMTCKHTAENVLLFNFHTYFSYLIVYNYDSYITGAPNGSFR